jgi:hypothetical protein
LPGDSIKGRDKRTVFANPSPNGRGCREAAGEGYKNEKTQKKFQWYPSPGPLARATLSRRERDLPPSYQFPYHEPWP